MIAGCARLTVSHRRRISWLGLWIGMTLCCFGGPFQKSEAAGLDEGERVRGFYARNYTWPVKEFVPETPGWRRLFEHRLRQVAEIDDKGQRYEGFIQTLQAGFLAPNFTEFGFGLARAPDDLMHALRQGIQDGLKEDLKEEEKISVIDGDHVPWFIERPDLTLRVLEELQHYPETWVNMELTPHVGKKTSNMCLNAASR